MKHFLPYLLSFIAGFALCYFINRSPEPQTITNEITLHDFNHMFRTQPKADIKTIVRDSIQVRIDTVKVPVDRGGDFRLYYNNIRISGNTVMIPLWNPTLGRYEIDSFTIPVKRWSNGIGISGYRMLPDGYGVEIDGFVRYRAISAFGRVGYNPIWNEYALVGVRVAL
jgi:hypothetical protein